MKMIMQITLINLKINNNMDKTNNRYKVVATFDSTSTPAHQIAESYKKAVEVKEWFEKIFTNIETLKIIKI